MVSDASNISFPREQELVLPKNIDANQLDKIWERLDTILLALEAIADFTPQEILRVAKELNLESVIEQPKALWRLFRSDLEDESSRNQELEIKKARSLVLIICYLARQHQELIRRAVSLLEQTAEEDRQPEQITLLANYLDKFFKIYQDKANEERISSDKVLQLALKKLIDLLFYSGNDGPYLLWSVVREDSF